MRSRSIPILILTVAAALAVTACSGAASDAPSPSQGEEIAENAGCMTCHTDADTAVAPTWRGLWNREVTLVDGTSIIADEAYLLRAIEEPSVEIVAGYPDTMPAFPLTDDEKSALVAYIRSLE